MAGKIGSQFDFYQNIRVNEQGAMLVDVSGVTLNASINVDLSHSGLTGSDGDSVQIGKGSNTVDVDSFNSLKTGLYDSGGTYSVAVNPDSSLKVSGATILVDSNGVNKASITNGYLQVSGVTTLGNEGGSVDMVQGALRVSGTTIIGSESGTVDIVSGHLKVSGLTQIASADGSEVVGITNKYLLVSGNTIIANETSQVDILSNNSLKISGSTLISDGTNSNKVFSDGTILIGGSGTKPQITFTSSAATTYSIGDILNSGDTTNMEQFTVLQSVNNEKSSWAIGGRGTRSATGTTSIDLHLFSSGFTLNGSDKDRFNPNINELNFYIGTISFTSWKTIGERAVSDGTTESPILLKPIENASDIIYGVFVLRNDYSRPANEVFTFSLDLDQN